MHINVRDILVESVGYSQFYKISGEEPQFEEIRRTKPVEGEFTLTRLDDCIVLQGQAASEIELECHRCLRVFTRPVQVQLEQQFAEDPSPEQMPIVDETIDIALLIEQEIILSLPIKILDRPDCPGIPEASEHTPTKDQASVASRARITKGTIKRGRT